jgi:molybdopterin/thiamine biosynthesis adenylyltransferase
LDRYIRHTVMPWFGARGQSLLSRSLVLVVGCGGVGCACASMLARSGVGRLRIVDRDVVGLTDIHRQILFDKADADEVNLKATIASERLTRANPEVSVEPVLTEFRPENADTLVADVDLLVDCSDNFQARMLINEVCLKHSKPWIHAACTDTTGMVIPFPVGSPACYACIVDHIPTGYPTCEDVGILGPVAAAVGCIEAAETIRLILGSGPSEQRIILFDILSDTWETVRTRGKPGCQVCKGRTYRYLDGIEPWSDRMVCSDGIMRLKPSRPLDADALQNKLPDSAELIDVGGALRVVVGKRIVILFPDNVALMKGFADAKAAQDFLDDLIGS